MDAQQARRLLDRMVGYKISPLLTRRVSRGHGSLSAGRVQSVALKLVVDRENEIKIFIPTEYWNIKVFLQGIKNKTPFEAYLYSVDGKKVEKEDSKKKNVFLIPSEKIASTLVERIKKASFTIDKVDRSNKKRSPYPPFITSTLQQEGARHFGFSATNTMRIAQGLYEGITLKNETVGLITYMRTDSVQVSNEAITQARTFIKKNYGEKYLPKSPNAYKSKKSAQEAHEAIRPTHLQYPPHKIKSHLKDDQYKLYKIIWDRFIASQMPPAIYAQMSYTIETDKKMVFRAVGSSITFDGFLAVYEEKLEKKEHWDDKMKTLPLLEEKTALKRKQTSCTQSFTKPKPRFTEASLIHELERLGIGRPSTYAAIMQKIQSRDYTHKEGRALKPTELGNVINTMLMDNFSMIMDVGFTAKMEDSLECIAEGDLDKRTLLQDFWSHFKPLVDRAEKEAIVPKIDTDIKCPKCSKHLQKIWSKNRYFYGCSGYPECEYTTTTEALEFKKSDYAKDFDWDSRCPICQKSTILRHGRYGSFLGCSDYPKCHGIVNIPKKGEKVVDTGSLPKCPAVGCDGRIMQRKSRFGKIFFSCSNFPECNVAVNDVADLLEKYKNHPKTKYVKRTKNGKYKLSEALQKIVKSKELKRGDIVKKIWVYIKDKNCQNPKNRSEILPDKNLEAFFGSKKPVHMTKILSYIKNHIS